MQEVNTKTLRGTLSDEDLVALRQRNEERAQQAKANLGRRWLCHPENQVQKVQRQGVLDSHWGK
jgi:hypothetical protein